MVRYVLQMKLVISFIREDGELIFIHYFYLMFYYCIHNQVDGAGAAIEVTNGLFILTDKTFDDAISKGHTFVKFFAPWCGHCKRLAPTWDALAKEYEHSAAINIAKVRLYE